MGNKGGKSSEVEISDHDRAVLDLKNARDTLKQYQKVAQPALSPPPSSHQRVRQKTEASMARHTEVARELLRQGNKKGALVVVKRKKMAEASLEKTRVQLDNVQTLIDDIEYAKVNVRVVEGLKAGRDALKELNSLVSVEEIEALLADNADQMAQAKEIDEALNARAGMLSPKDEEDIEAEYALLLQSEALHATEALPTAPTADPQPAQPDAVAAKRKPVQMAAE